MTDTEMFGGLIGMMLMALIGVTVYLIPVIVAFRRHHRERNGIMILDLLFGWTFIGWAIALIWSVSRNVEDNY